MIYDQTVTIKAFLDAAAAKKPIPGGGSVAALTGALAASMGEMVLNYSVGKKSLAAFEGELRPALAELTAARRLMTGLMEEDQAGYEVFSALQKLPADSPERKDKEEAALLVAIRVPEAIAATGVSIMEICDRMVNFVNYHLLSDLAVCADLAMATVRCATYNVRVNLKQVRDEADRRRIESACGQILSRAAGLIERVSPRIWEREGRGVSRWGMRG